MPGVDAEDIKRKPFNPDDVYSMDGKNFRSEIPLTTSTKHEQTEDRKIEIDSFKKDVNQQYLNP